MDWTLTPMGWGEAHELGHNMQIGLLQIGWVPVTSNADLWSSYQGRAGENSNNIFPVHNNWRFYRKVKKYNNSVSGAWSGGHLDSFSIIQSALVKKNATLSGISSRVSLRSGTCTIKASFPSTASAAQVRLYRIIEYILYWPCCLHNRPIDSYFIFFCIICLGCCRLCV